MRLLGSQQSDEIKAHKHAYGPYAAILMSSGGTGYSFNVGSNYLKTDSYGGAETRPANTAMAPRIYR